MQHSWIAAAALALLPAVAVPHTGRGAQPQARTMTATQDTSSHGRMASSGTTRRKHHTTKHHRRSKSRSGTHRQRADSTAHRER